MLEPEQKVALYAEATMGLLNAKMTEGVIRYGRNPVVAVIDSKAAGRTVGEVCRMDSTVPIVASLREAIARGAEVLILGTAPSGGHLPQGWLDVLKEAVDDGLCIVNGLHDRLNDIFGKDLKPGQWVWDVRAPVGEPPAIANALAAALPNTRVLMIGTDMAIGKMTAGLEIYRGLRERGRDVVFLPSGQIGITIMGIGVPLDAVRVDHASGAVEAMVMEHADHDIQIIEGQGSLLHPGSTATLPLMRGSCCNKMVLCHRAGMTHLDSSDHLGDGILLPPMRDVIALNEQVAAASGALTPARVVGMALNTKSIDDDQEARDAIARLEDEVGLPVEDPVRFGAGKLADAVE